MKKTIAIFTFLVLMTGAVLCQSTKDAIVQPNHVTGRNFDASGEVGAQYSADFQYNSDGMLSSFEFPRINLTSQFVYNNRNLNNIHTHWYYNSGYGLDFTWDQVFEFENGLLQMDYTREYEATYDNEDYDYCFYYYDDNGQLIRKEQGYEPDHICQFWTYKYDDQGRTDSVFFYISWGCPGYTRLSGIYAYHYDNDLLQEIMIEEYDDINNNYDIWYTKRQIFTYTEDGKPFSEIKQNLVDDEWVNSTIHIYLYDTNGKIAEQHDGIWSDSLDVWDINKKIIHEFSPTDMTYTVSFYKKDGEDWVWDVFNGQTLFFEPELQWQQREMENFWQVNQIEFTMTQMESFVFQSDNLLYTTISTEPSCVSLIGHVDGTEAQGELVIPETVAFANIVYTVTEIADSAFMNCSGLTGVLNIPSSIQTIGKSAFSGCSGFSELVFHDGLLEICEEAFYGCSGFTGTLDFPETVVRIKYAAFRGCNGFSGDLVFPNALQSLGDTQNKNHVDETAWSVVANCFEHLFLPPSLDTIGPYCFAGCSRLKGDLIIPDNVKVIYYNAFAVCSGFTSLTLGDSLVIIDMYAFAECNGIKGTVVIPDVYEIGANAFDRCRGIQELILPTHVSRFHQNVFVRCSSLTEIDIPEGWTHTGNGTFYQCSNLQRVHLPESLITIGDDCFAQCTKLEEINIPEGVTTIGELAFEKCENLENIELPPSLRQLGQGAFAYCTKLKGKMVIPDKVQRLDAYELLETPGTFESCSLLTCIVLGDSINFIDEGNFRNTQLDSLVIKAVTPPTLIRNTYGNSWHFPTDCHIVVPCGSLEAYQNSDSWHSFTQITEDCGFGFNSFTGSEWYYEILNNNGSITYQYLQCAGDTTINEERPKVLIRSNTQYDRGETIEITHEYLYERNGIVYWWNKTLDEFTILYDLTANVGDEWEIKVGTESIIMHVDAVDYYEYEGQTYRMLRVSDSDDVFSGNIVCGIGHLTSFFPERLMTRDRGYRVEGLRCYWVDGGLVFNPNRVDCDAIYSSLHDMEEQIETTFTVYPNPTNGILFVETRHATSLPDQNEYRITNLMGQTLLQGHITDETQQIDIANLPSGMYFISVGEQTVKFVVR